MRALGTDDSVNACDCCGKSGLKSTVIVELDSGEIAHYGSTCATRNTGKTTGTINREIREQAAKVRESARAELRAHPAHAALQAALARRPRTLLGRAAAEFIRNEDAAEAVAREQIAARHGLKGFELGI